MGSPICRVEVNLFLSSRVVLISPGHTFIDLHPGLSLKCSQGTSCDIITWLYVGFANQDGFPLNKLLRVTQDKCQHSCFRESWWSRVSRSICVIIFLKTSLTDFSRDFAIHQSWLLTCPWEKSVWQDPVSHLLRIPLYGVPSEGLEDLGFGDLCKTTCLSISSSGQIGFWKDLDVLGS